MRIDEVTENYGSSKIFVTIEQKTEDGFPRKKFEYLVYTGGPGKIEFVGLESLKQENDSVWHAEEVAAFEEMKQLADEEAQRRFNNEHIKELFDR